jgi:hypothetical protein
MSIMVLIGWKPYYCWKAIEIVHHMVVLFPRFRVVWQRYDNYKRYTNCNLMIWMWSGNTSGLLVPSSNPHRFHEKINIFVKTYKKFAFIYVAKYVMCAFRVPRYHDKEVQCVVSLNLWHLDNTMVFSFPKCVIYIKEVGLYPSLTHDYCTWHLIKSMHSIKLQLVV